MKALTTLIFIIFVATSAMAQQNTEVAKATTFTAGIVSTIKIPAVNAQSNEVARLYMFKNSRVKKALSFRTKRDKARMA